MLDNSVSKDFSFGYENGKRWICGTVEIGKKKVVYIDTRTGKGVNDILNKLNNFISYQASKVKFPSYSREDVMQEIRLLALEAIPKYDITKNTNMITFLQNHVKNRLINLCKFFSEKRRRATFCNTHSCKIRCPSCSKFFVANDGSGSYSCPSCHYTASENSVKWKKYNIPILPISSNMIKSEQSEDSDGEMCVVDLISENDSNLGFIMEIGPNLDDRVNQKMDFFKIYNRLDNTNKKILRMVMEGYTYRDIAKEVGLSDKAAYARVSKIIKS